MNEERFVVVALLMAAYPNVPAPAATMKLYVEMLSDIPDDVLAMGTRHVISRHKYNTWPTIAEIRETCIDLQTGAANYQNAYDAWESVIKAIRRNGYMRRPVFEANPLIDKAIDAVGGWRLLCLSEDVTADRSRFIQAYESFFKRAADDTHMLPEVRALTKQLAGNQFLLDKPKEP